MEKKNALISVYNKAGIVEFVAKLIALGWTIYSSGGTAKKIREAGHNVIDVADLSGLPAILDHRVVTLAPQIHAGLLALPEEDHLRQLEFHGFPWFDLVCVDFYPLSEETRKEGATTQSVIDKTDIGGPTMVRSAAKGRRIVVIDADDRSRVLAWLEDDRPNEEVFIGGLTAKAEAIVASYCLESARFHGPHEGLIGTLVRECKYGENGWQTPAGLYAGNTGDPLAMHKFVHEAGNPMGYVNYTDIDRLLQIITHVAAAMEGQFGFDGIPRIAVGVKHGNPCGAGVAQSANESLTRMIEGDLDAIYGGFVMTNFPIGMEEAKTLLEWKANGQKRFLNGVIAPSFTDEAINLLSRKSGTAQILSNLALSSLNQSSLCTETRKRQVRGGLLAQPAYSFVLNLKHEEIQVEGDALSEQQIIDMYLAWAIGSTSNSNTITLVKDGMLIGNGVGQQSRVRAVKLALSIAEECEHTVQGAGAYSDSFFPFADGPEVLAQAGVTSVFASRGSKRDEEVKAAFEEAGMTWVSLPDKVCRGFFGH